MKEKMESPFDLHFPMHIPLHKGDDPIKAERVRAQAQQDFDARCARSSRKRKAARFLAILAVILAVGGVSVSLVLNRVGLFFGTWFAFGALMVFSIRLRRVNWGVSVNLQKERYDDDN